MSSEISLSDILAGEPEDAKHLLGEESSALLVVLREELRRKSRTVWLQWAIILCLVITVIVLIIFGSTSRQFVKCGELFFAQSPPLNDVLDQGLHDDTINGSTHYRSRWQGHPNDDLDVAWHSIVNEKLMGISFDEAQSLGKPLDELVQIPSDLTSRYGEGIVVSSDMAHQLHCLNMIRMYTYEDYYRHQPHVPLIFRQNSEKILRAHIDHCIDVLRQNIMCSGDTSLITHQWIKGRPLIKPDFNVSKQCRSFQAMMGWIESHGIPELRQRPGFGVPKEDEAG